ncbi:armadillo-type protein [Melampsora americana]|nr:armadillo-type protein [Melampsora americana]
MEENLSSPLQQLEAALSDPKESYEFVSRNGKNPQILPYLIQILIDPAYQFKNELRTQAAIMIRNGIDSWYRKISPNQLQPQEKIDLGRKLVDDILAKGESDSVLRKQIALSVGKIGKWNFDSNLSNLFEVLMFHIGKVFTNESWSNDPTNFCILNGCLGAVYQIIQNMITNRSMRGQLLLREVTQNHFVAIYDVYSSVLSSWTTSISQQTTLNLSVLFHSQNSIALSRVCLKILGQLATYSWREPHKEELPTNFVRQSINQLEHILTIRKKIVELISLHKTTLAKKPTATSIESFFNLLNKHVFKYGKIFIQIFDQDSQLLNITGIRECLMQTIWKIIEEGSINTEFVDDESTPVYLAALPERLLIQSLQIMTQITSIVSPSIPISATPAMDLAQIILTRLLPLRKHSLEFWAEDPESYDNEEIALMENVTFDIRSASANLLSRLLMIYPQELVGIILRLYAELQLLDPSNLKYILQMEAIYLGIGLSVTKLVSPEATCTSVQWIKERFIPLLCLTDSDGRVLRRRIAWVLGQFAKEVVDLDTQSGIYFGINCLLENPNNDIATKLAACRALKLTANWESPSQGVHPILAYLGNYIGHISTLFTLVENLDSQKVLTETLGLVIEKAGLSIRPYAAQLTDQMTSLWQQVAESPSKSNSASHLHNAILVTMATLVEALESDSHNHHDMICVLVEYSINPNNQASVYLQEDGMILWLTTLRQATSLTPQLSNLLPRLIGLARDANDSLAIVLKILQSYILLDAPILVDTCGSALAVTLSELLQMSAGLSPIKEVLNVLTYIVQCYPIAQWKPWLEGSGCFEVLLQASLKED